MTRYLYLSLKTAFLPLGLLKVHCVAGEPSGVPVHAVYCPGPVTNLNCRHTNPLCFPIIDRTTLAFEKPGVGRLQRRVQYPSWRWSLHSARQQEGRRTAWLGSSVETGKQPENEDEGGALWILRSWSDGNQSTKCYTQRNKVRDTRPHRVNGSHILEVRREHS